VQFIGPSPRPLLNAQYRNPSDIHTYLPILTCSSQIVICHSNLPPFFVSPLPPPSGPTFTSKSPVTFVSQPPRSTFTTSPSDLHNLTCPSAHHKSQYPARLHTKYPPPCPCSVRSTHPCCLQLHMRMQLYVFQCFKIIFVVYFRSAQRLASVLREHFLRDFSFFSDLSRDLHSLLVYLVPPPTRFASLPAHHPTSFQHRQSLTTSWQSTVAIHSRTFFVPALHPLPANSSSTHSLRTFHLQLQGLHRFCKGVSPLLPITDH